MMINNNLILTLHLFRFYKCLTNFQMILTPYPNQRFFFNNIKERLIRSKFQNKSTKSIKIEIKIT